MLNGFVPDPPCLSDISGLDDLIDKELARMRGKGSLEYAQGIIDVYESENLQKKGMFRALVSPFLGSPFGFYNNPMYTAAKIYVGENVRRNG